MNTCDLCGKKVVECEEGEICWCVECSKELCEEE